MSKLLLLTIFAFLFLGCTSPDQTMSRQKAFAQIDELYRQFSIAYDRFDTDMVANLYAEDAFYLIPNPQVPALRGRSSIRESFSGFIDGAANNNRAIDISFRIINRKISDSLAFDVGYYRSRSKADTAAVFPEGGSVGKFVTVIGIMPDGSWKFLLDGYSPAPRNAFDEVADAHNPAKGDEVTN